LKQRLAAISCAALLAALVPTATPALDGAPAASPLQAPVPANVPIALLVDLSSGQTLFSRDADRRFVPASVTKVMSAYTAFKLIDSGKLSPATQLVVSKEIDEKWSGEGSSMYLKAGDRVTVGQLLLGITTVSGNDAAVMLAVSAVGSMDNWLALMNANAAELGMRNTHFGTPNGWMDEGRTYTSARDLVLLSEAMTTRYRDLYRRYFGHHRMTYNGIQQVNHDPVTGMVEGADGIKTGYTRQAGYNVLGSAERDGRRLVVVIAGAPTPGDRNRTARELLEWGFAAFQTRQLVAGGAAVGTAQVQGGAARHVPLQTMTPVLASAAADGALPRSTLEIRYSGPLEAPIRRGDQVATLRVSTAGRPPHDVPLVAASDVAPANPLQRLRNGLLGLVS
jgi:D-alanyl-D-alanine carboxypeptidase (penicillin-binding protein 5/6)